MVATPPSTVLRRSQAHVERAEEAPVSSRKRSVPDYDTYDVNDNSNSRKRITRACDQCNSLRSKCNGKHPCAHCAESQLPCAYERRHKKRGRVPKKGQSNSDGLDTIVFQEPTVEADRTHYPKLNGEEIGTAMSGAIRNIGGEVDSSNHLAATVPSATYYGALSNDTARISSTIMATNTGYAPSGIVNYGPCSSSAFNAANLDISGFGFPLGDDYSVAFMGRAPMIDSPDWFAITSPNFGGEKWSTPPRAPDAVRYPVLQPILQQLEPIMPYSFACDLLEQYFTTVSSTSYHPKNTYVVSFIFRKHAILHPTNPRPCTPALLASMLWISAQYSDSSFLSSQPGARARICQKLLEMIITRLKPVVHNQDPVLSGSNGHSKGNRMDAGFGGLLLPIDIATGEEGLRQQVDNIVTYIHLGTIVSASERKAASLRWWNVAWSLARESRLGRELPTQELINEDCRGQRSINDVSQVPNHGRAASSASDPTNNKPKTLISMISEEDREERRRTWWLLYMMDKHLAICYNRPAFFLNKECEGLLLPMDEHRYQMGQFQSEAIEDRHRGLDVECTSLTHYGFTLPLMVILGEILDLNHARNRPRLGPGAKRPRDFSETISEIEEQLGAFERSLTKVWTDEQKNNIVTTIWTNETSYTHNSRQNGEQALHSTTVVAYGTHIMHVLHILLTGKWDPVALLDDNDLWISSQSFVNATSHAVSAAKALADIIDYDPELSFMPFFFGIYLLQGSFLLLLFADKLQGNITPDVVSACETIVRAHEACVSTLDTQYQRNFRRVMRSALQQLRGRMHEDATEQQNWRREILKLYRWTGDGTGLAL